ncbi:hypothetical protein DAPPUDRAFT_264900 [Daphnia pulex]|uniref:Uncharacterized protein n=1 Tax=Daphnia pulex TaxID=6669 RepID=E9HSI9_DAPPU|nr:hypothetical protein DAPPUDRAFT_264900 [Daphnia pulex]|eukprot:EFX65300.1 hypothetical protein DAPPUDRAFT_264900 [Daphnia pulex]
MANTLSNVLPTAFEEEMVTKTYRKICTERWIHEARIMHKYMDLHLIDLLEENQIDQVLDYIKDPKHFYACVLRRLISLKVPDVKEEWSRFKSQVKDAVKQAALATFNVNSGLAQTFVNNLRDEFSDGGLQSHAMASAFSIDCSGEYEESDNEDKKKFQEDCEYELNEAIENVISLNDHEGFSEELSPKVVQYMKTVNNQIALPRCDAHCPNCFSLCIEAFNHDTKHRPHDAIHQPGGVAGQRCRDTNKLVYPEWKDPRINEESPLREYILATYNNKIAEKCGRKPCPNVPASYFRVLSTIKEQLNMDIV